MHSINANPSLLALPRTAKRKTSHTRIPRIGATSCIRRMEREEKASKKEALFCSQKEGKEVPRAKANPKEKAKESREKARVIAKARGRKERTLVAQVALWMTPAISASKPDIIRRSVLNSQHYLKNQLRPHQGQIVRGESLCLRSSRRLC